MICIHERIHQSLHTAYEAGFTAIRIWLTETDWQELVGSIERDIDFTINRVRYYDIPVSIDRSWCQPSRLIFDDGQKLRF